MADLNFGDLFAFFPAKVTQIILYDAEAYQQRMECVCQRRGSLETDYQRGSTCQDQIHLRREKFSMFFNEDSAMQVEVALRHGRVQNKTVGHIKM